MINIKVREDMPTRRKRGYILATLTARRVARQVDYHRIEDTIFIGEATGVTILHRVDIGVIRWIGNSWYEEQYPANPTYENAPQLLSDALDRAAYRRKEYYIN